jgi:hypothetical protein
MKGVEGCFHPDPAFERVEEAMISMINGIVFFNARSLGGWVEVEDANPICM